MSTSTLTNAQIAGAKRSKKYKALLLIGMSEGDAMKAYQRTIKGVEIDPQPNPVEDLVKAGFSEDEARKVLVQSGEEPEATPEVVAEPVVVTTPIVEADTDDDYPAEGLLARHGLVMGEGRVYLTPDVLEAAVRFRKTQKAEVVMTATTVQTHAVLVGGGRNGAVCIQNLKRPHTTEESA